MSIRTGLVCAAACLATWLSTGASGIAAAAPADVTPPANDDCLACHGDASLKRDDGRSLAVDAKLFEGSMHGPLACVDCHADLAKAELPHEAKLARVRCASCHDDIGGKYHDSIHAWAKEKAGLTTAAPSCADCHGTHDIKAHTDQTSRVFRDRVPATCGSCHAGIREQYDRGIHAAALKKGDSRAPVCVDCHTTHSIQRVDTDKWRLSVTRECGTCHVESMRTFRDTFHGQVTALGFVRVAACADCHGAHDIVPQSDARSTVSPARLVQTCGRCHSGATASFVRYDPHADRHDKARNSSLYFAAQFMNWLLLGVFAFFGLHTVLWLQRAIRAQREVPR